MISLMIIFSLLATPISSASGSKYLKKLWERSGGKGVITSPELYKRQGGGHFDAGSAYFARPPGNKRILSVTPPEINLSTKCANQGFLNFGGMSFLSGKEIGAKIQNIATEAGMMIVMQGFSLISPVIGATLQEVFSKLQELGGMLSDECRAAESVKAALGDAFTGKKSLAESISTNFNLFGNKKDAAEAHKKEPTNEDLAAAAKKDEKKIIQDINLGWEVLKKYSLRAGTDSDIFGNKQELLSLAGTIIIRANKSDPTSPDVQYIAPTIDDAKKLEAFMYGGVSLKLIGCKDKEKCLIIFEASKDYSKSDSFYVKIEEKVNSIFKSIKHDEDMTSNSEIHVFLKQTGLPMFAIADTIYRDTGGNPTAAMAVYNEVIAWQFLFNYLDDLLRRVEEEAGNLVLGATTELKQYKDSLYETRVRLNEVRRQVAEKYRINLSFVQLAKEKNQQLTSYFQQTYANL